jgi:GTPase SAR1 family protein
MNKTTADVVTPSRVDMIFGPTTRRVRRLAVFGPRGSGKTCFFASLYGQSADSFSSTTFDHEPTLEYLERMWNAYSKGASGFPDPNPLEVPRQLLFHMADINFGRQWQAEILDHAGELVERVHNGGDASEPLRDIVRTWLRECETILIFLDTTQSDSEESLERRNEVAILLQLCREASESGHVTRPLGLVLTKWDSLGSDWTNPLLEDGDNQPGDDAKLEAKLAKQDEVARRYLSQTPSLRQIHRTVEAFGKTVKLFPVSAIGVNRQPGRKPTHPYNILTPLLWALRQTDESRAQAAHSKANGKAASRAIQAYEELINLDGVNCGPVFEKVAPQLKELKKRQRAWRLGKLAAIAVTLFTTVVMAIAVFYFSWSAYADRQYGAWLAYCESNEGKGDESAGNRAKMADGILHWHGIVLSHEQKSRIEKSLLADRVIERDEAERSEWNAIKADRERIDSLKDDQEVKKLELLESVKSRLEAFGEKLGGIKAGREWESELATVKVTLDEHIAQRKRYNDVVEDQEKSSPADPTATERLITSWERYIKSSPMPNPYYMAQANTKLEACQDVYDGQVLDKLGGEWIKEPNRQELCSAFIKKVESVKLYNKPKKAAAIKELIDDALLKADKLSYYAAKEALITARGCPKAVLYTSLQTAKSQILEYLNSKTLPDLPAKHTRPLKMEKEAKRCLSWFGPENIDEQQAVLGGERSLIPQLPNFK